ncbi:MAG: hypothetical protein ACOH2C_17450, partial [Clostridium sp.]
ENVLNLPIEAITTTDGKRFVYVSKAGSGSIAGAGGNAAMDGKTGQAGRAGQVGTDTTGTSKGSSRRNSTGSTGKVSANSIAGSLGKSSSATSEKQSYYDGCVQTEVQVGSNNDTSIEITSGLKEGDVIVLPETKAASTAKSTSTKSSGGMGGGPGGGF